MNETEGMAQFETWMCETNCMFNCFSCAPRVKRELDSRAVYLSHVKVISELDEELYRRN